MEIIKSKRVCRCLRCAKLIDQKYKVEEWKGEYSHLNCSLNNLKKELVRIKKNISKFSKQKYKKQLILENL